MSSRRKLPGRDKTDATRKLPKPEIRDAATLAQDVVDPALIVQRAKVDPGTLSPHDVLSLRRTIGNQAVGQLLVQAKLAVNAPGDAYEQEADHVAAQVVDGANVSAQADAQRQEDEGELATTKPDIQRLEANGGGSVDADVEAAIQEAQTGGQPLGDSVREPMERAIGADLSRVKVHADAQSDQISRSIQARAFTTGQDVFFRQGEYDPGSDKGQALLAHELTHVVQQGGSDGQSQTVQRKTRNLTGGKDLAELKGVAGGKKSTFAQIKSLVAKYNEIPMTDTKLEDLRDQRTMLGSILALIHKWKQQHLAFKQVGHKQKLKPTKDKDKQKHDDIQKLEPIVANEWDAVQKQFVEQAKVEPTGVLNLDEEHVLESEYQAVGGALNKLDKVKYVGKDDKEFVGYFQAEQLKDLQYGGHRGTASGIPEKDPNFSGRSIAMYRLNVMLGEDLIPLTAKVEHRGRPGILMEAVPGKSLKAMLGQKLGDKDRELSKLYLLDIIAGQVDRHFGNIIVDVSGHIHGIDNDLAFGKDYDPAALEELAQEAKDDPVKEAKLKQLTHGKMPSQLEVIDQKFADKIIYLADSESDKVRAQLKGLITKSEINATIRRLQWLANHLKELIKNGDKRLS